MSSDLNTAMLNTCRAVCWILAFAAGLFVATVCVYWAGLHGLLSAVIGLIALLGAGYLFPELFCTGRDAVPAEPEAPAVAATTAVPVVPEVAPQREVQKPKLYGDAPDNIDDLKVISGVGPALEKKLNGLGVYRYEQIASWTPANVKWVDEKLSFRGRIERDNWVKQAGELARG